MRHTGAKLSLLLVGSFVLCSPACTYDETEVKSPSLLGEVAANRPVGVLANGVDRAGITVRLYDSSPDRVPLGRRQLRAEVTCVPPVAASALTLVQPAPTDEGGYAWGSLASTSPSVCTVQVTVLGQTEPTVLEETAAITFVTSIDDTVAFATAEELAAPGVPYAVATADSTNPDGSCSGNTTLLSLSFVSATVTIWDADWRGMQPPTEIGLPAPWPRAIAVGGFDHACASDAVIAHSDAQNSLTVLRFADAVASTSLVAPSPLRAVALGDFTGDDRLDLALTSPNEESVIVARGVSGSGFFDLGNAQTLGSELTPVAAATGRLNDDARADLAVANISSETVSVYLAQEDGLLAETLTVGLPCGGPSALAVSDLNGDGLGDIVVSCAVSNEVAVLMQVADTSDAGIAFATARTTPVGNQPLALAVGDLNLDQVPDVAVANSSDDTVSVLLGLGNDAGELSLAASPDTGDNPISVAIGDYNHDSYPDIATANSEAGTITVIWGP